MHVYKYTCLSLYAYICMCMHVYAHTRARIVIPRCVYRERERPPQRSSGGHGTKRKKRRGGPPTPTRREAKHKSTHRQGEQTQTRERCAWLGGAFTKTAPCNEDETRGHCARTAAVQAQTEQARFSPQRLPCLGLFSRPRSMPTKTRDTHDSASLPLLRCSPTHPPSRRHSRQSRQPRFSLSLASPNYHRASSSTCSSSSASGQAAPPPQPRAAARPPR